MRIRNLLLLPILVLPLSGQADPLFGKEMAGDRKLPGAFGIGIDYFNISQPYQIDSLSVCELDPCLSILGGLLPSLSGATGIVVENDAENIDLKLDLWLFPFLNIFGVYGQIDGRTTVDLRNVGVLLPPSLEVLNIGYDGDVYGGGVVLAVGGDKWFASLTATITDTSLSGTSGSTIDSSVEATTIQPRIGVRATETTEVWIGGYFIDAEEKHRGSIDFTLGLLAPPGVPPSTVVPIDFGVNLSQQEDFNFSIGLHSMFSEHWEATVEVGGGDRNTALANLTYRF
jgi:hypothetical protein